jgi:hypothetical protein
MIAMDTFYIDDAENHSGHEPERKAPLGQSVAIIAALSALAWATLILIVLGFRALF